MWWADSPDRKDASAGIGPLAGATELPVLNLPSGTMTADAVTPPEYFLLPLDTV
jgi:hypothetical protein